MKYQQMLKRNELSAMCGGTQTAIPEPRRMRQED